MCVCVWEERKWYKGMHCDGISKTTIFTTKKKEEGEMGVKGMSSVWMIRDHLLMMKWRGLERLV